jgi:hypothetical protein
MYTYIRERDGIKKKKKRKLKTAGGLFTLIFLVQPPRCLFFFQPKK